MGRMSPEMFAIRCREIAATMRGHEAHKALDFLTNDVLRELGYGEGIAVFEAAVKHWHAAADQYPYQEPCPDCDRDGAEGRDGLSGSGPSGPPSAGRQASPSPPHLQSERS